MAFGSIGYPQRTMAPTSHVVDYQMSPEDWARNWQGRWDANKAAQAAPSFDDQVAQQVRDYQAGAGNPNDFTSAFDYAKEALADPSGNAIATYTGQPSTGGSGLPTNRDLATTAFGEDFWGLAPHAPALNHSAQLEAERAALTPVYAGVKRAQQGYGAMTGWGQSNGIRGADYSDPNFGKITGYFGQDKLGDAGAGTPAVDDTLLGTSPQLNSNSTIWGAAPVRPRIWGA
jgi:hypothetical protein